MSQPIQVQVKLFARLREELGTGELTLTLPSGSTAADALDQLAAQGEPWQQLKGDRPVMLAINQAMAKPVNPLQEGDELALFPPVTGG